MDSTVLRWLLRIQQLEAIIKTRNDELHAHYARLAKIQQELHNTVNEQNLLEDAALQLQLKKVQLQCTQRELQTEMKSMQAQVHTEICPQPELDEVSTRNKRLKTKIKKEKADMQTFVGMMKSINTERQQACDSLKLHMQQVKQHNKELKMDQIAHTERIAALQAQQQATQTTIASLQLKRAQVQSDIKKAQQHLSTLQNTSKETLQNVQKHIADEKKALHQALAKKEALAKRLYSEQSLSNTLGSRQKELQVVLQRVKKAMLELSE